MRLIGIVCYPTFGGSGVIATQIATFLATQHKKYQVHLFSYRVPYRLKENIENLHFHQIPLIEYPLFPFSLYTMGLTGELLKLKLHIIHLHYAIPHTLSAILAKKISKLNFKIITTIHGTDLYITRKREEIKKILVYCLENSDIVTCVSNYLKNCLIEELKLRRKIELIPNFVDTKVFFPNKDGKKREIKRILHVSNFRPLKRIEDVIEAFANVSSKYNKGVELVLVGDGPQKKIAEKLTKKYRITQNVHFLGEVKNVEEIYREADIFLLPSEEESFGLAALEALASGLPVVATNVGGIPEVVLDGKVGFLTQVKDVDSLAKYLLLLLEDKNLYETMSKEALNHAKKFDISKILPLYLKIYNSDL